MKKQKIAIIGLKGLPAYGGGTARAMENIINLLKDKYDFTIYSIDSHTNKKGYVNGYEQIVFSSFKLNKSLNTFFYYWKCLFHSLFFRKYDLIHLNHGPSGFITPFLKVKYKVVTSLRGVYSEHRHDDKFNRLSNFFFKQFQFLNFKFSDVLISVSKYEIQYCKKYTHKPVRYIPNGININEKISLQKLEYENYLLFAAGRIYGIKGCDILLKALKILEFNEKVLIIGDLNHDRHNKKVLLELAVGLNIDFLELIKEKALLMKYLQEAKLFIFPSRAEGMSNMLLEAASMKCPIICSDIPANTSVFSENEVTLFKSESSEDLARKIRWALNNLPVIRDKAENAYNLLKSDYSWNIIAQQYDEVYGQLIDE